MLSPLIKRMVEFARPCAANESSSVPVDPAPAVPVAVPMRHVRKLAFAFGAGAVLLALYLVERLLGFAP